MYAVSEIEPYYVTENEEGIKTFSTQGSFSDVQNNRLGETEVEYRVEFYAFVDTNFDPITCLNYKGQWKYKLNQKSFREIYLCIKKIKIIII